MTYKVIARFIIKAWGSSVRIRTRVLDAFLWLDLGLGF